MSAAVAPATAVTETGVYSKSVGRIFGTPMVVTGGVLAVASLVGSALTARKQDPLLTQYWLRLRLATHAFAASAISSRVRRSKLRISENPI
ncbi:MAG: hypothetical protein BJ554DRAFT_49 [Olpidium bornovanus]|uniref:Uncharacterized protein n=1 Tax=Olpidium bornovanus TaxID=278681 RepID=A0A8H7ZUG7_9FUNG|nr:MAG: hypothetical protein BJ554DRAFT_49 [Olpidium bornovanus]